MKNEPIYLAPKLFAAYKKRYLDNIKHNPWKSDIYSLGLCIVEAGLGKNIQPIYNGHDID